MNKIIKTLDNRKAFFNAEEGTLDFKFNNQYFHIDIPEGEDREDFTQDIQTLEGVQYELELTWPEGIPAPLITITRLNAIKLRKLGYCFSERETSVSPTKIKVKILKGTRANFLGLEFNKDLPLKYRVWVDGELVYITKTPDRLGRLSKNLSLFKKNVEVTVTDTNGSVAMFQ